MRRHRRRRPMRAQRMRTLMATLVLAAGLPALGAAPPSAPAPEKKADAGPTMVTYYLGVLRKGPTWTAEQTPEVQSLLEGHLDHLRKMGASGKLVLAGPLTDDKELRGILVFKVASADEAIALESEDPAVKAGRLVLEVHPWLVQKGILP